MGNLSDDSSEDEYMADVDDFDDDNDSICHMLAHNVFLKVQWCQIKTLCETLFIR